MYIILESLNETVLDRTSWRKKIHVSDPNEFRWRLYYYRSFLVQSHSIWMLVT